MIGGTKCAGTSLSLKAADEARNALNDDLQTDIAQLSGRWRSAHDAGETLGPLADRLRQLHEGKHTALVDAASHLLDSVAAGRVSNIELATGLIGDAVEVLTSGEGASDRPPVHDQHVLDLIEALDALASGIADVSRPAARAYGQQASMDDSAEAPSQPASDTAETGSARTDTEKRPEPPILTIREDGSRVELGAFLADPPQTTVGRSRVDTVVDDLGAAIKRLDDQLAALRSGADLDETHAALTQTAAELSALKSTLADWVRDSAALLNEQRA